MLIIRSPPEEYKVPLWFPLDPGPGASIGGMCACRCSGSTAVRYGSMRDNVLNVTAVLPDGQVIKTGSRARKSSAGGSTKLPQPLILCCLILCLLIPVYAMFCALAWCLRTGYDLTRLLIGTEGTLAVITEVALKLHGE